MLIVLNVGFIAVLIVDKLQSVVQSYSVRMELVLVRYP